MRNLDRKEQKKRDLERVPAKQIKDKTAAKFKLVGGPYHNSVVRVYAPWDSLNFDGDWYDIHPPLGNSDEYVYIHNPKGNNND